jgi:hypothetical protein
MAPTHGMSDTCLSLPSHAFCLGVIEEIYNKDSLPTLYYIKNRFWIEGKNSILTCYKFPRSAKKHAMVGKGRSWEKRQLLMPFQWINLAQ